jgi:hypothetical protein
MAKRASGGKREGDKLRALRAEAAAASPLTDDAATAEFEAARVEGNGAAAAGLEALTTLRAAMRLAARNEAVPLSQRVDQVVRAASALAKAADPEARIEELATDLRAAHSDIQALEDRLRAEAQSTRDQGGPSPTPLQ